MDNNDISRLMSQVYELTYERRDDPEFILELARWSMHLAKNLAFHLTEEQIEKDLFATFAVHVLHILVETGDVAEARRFLDGASKEELWEK